MSQGHCPQQCNRRLKGCACPHSTADEWDEPTKVICHCCKETMALWEDPTVREVLKRRKVCVEESPGFFLDDLEHITSAKYLPSNDDARLKTISISEYCFDMETTMGRKSGSEWRIFDVSRRWEQEPAANLGPVL